MRWSRGVMRGGSGVVVRGGVEIIAISVWTCEGRNG